MQTGDHDKTCYRCKRKLPFAAYYRDRSRADGHSARCKECDKAKTGRYIREVYYPAHRARIIEAAAAGRKARRSRAGGGDVP